MFTEFIINDVRKDRELVPITEESLRNRFQVMLPTHIINGATVLDVGSATGVAGRWCVDNKCKSYTGVELQDNYYQTSKLLLPEAEFIQSDALQFLKKTDRKWEVVIAAGIVHGYLNPFEILKSICDVATDYIIIESNDTVETEGIPTIHFRSTNMVFGGDMKTPYHGLTSFVGSAALEAIMNEYGWVGQRVYPKQITSGVDAYNQKIKWHTKLPDQVMRYIYIFQKDKTKKVSLEHMIKEDIR